MYLKHIPSKLNLCNYLGGERQDIRDSDCEFAKLILAELAPLAALAQVNAPEPVSLRLGGDSLEQNYGLGQFYVSYDWEC